jgi:hypothetical protein
MARNTLPVTNAVKPPVTDKMRMEARQKYRTLLETHGELYPTKADKHMAEVSRNEWHHVIAREELANWEVEGSPRLSTPEPPVPVITPQSAKPIPLPEVPAKPDIPTSITHVKDTIRVTQDNGEYSMNAPRKQQALLPNYRGGQREVDPGIMSATQLGLPNGMFITMPTCSYDLHVLTQSSLESYRVVRGKLMKYGLDVRFDPQGKGEFSNHQVYKVMAAPYAPGFTPPANYWVKRPVRFKESRYVMTAINIAIREICQVATVAIAGQEQGWFTEWNGFDEDEIPKKKRKRKVEGSTKGLPDMDEDQVSAEVEFVAKVKKRLRDQWEDFDTFSRSVALAGAKDYTGFEPEDSPVSVDGNGVAIKWVPKLEWFRDDLQTIPDEQLLSLIPQAEREVFMLGLGRSLLGREGSLLCTARNNEYQTQPLKWRSINLFEGREGGMGRSTLLSYLQDGFEYLGYAAGAIADIAGRFSHGRSASLAFGYIDDLSPENTIRAIASDTLKTLASGGRIFAEEKGLPGYQATAEGVYMLCTNRLQLDKMADLDSGNLSRLMAMRNYTTRDQWYAEYRQKYGYNLNVDTTYANLAKQHGVSVTTLVLLLLARCAERFRVWVDSGDQQGLVDHLNSLRSQFVIQTNLNHCESMFRAYFEFCADGMHQLPKTLDMSHFIRVVHNMCASGKQIPDLADSPELTMSYANLALGSSKRGQPLLARTFFECLTSTSGMSYPHNLAELTQKFFHVRGEMDVTRSLGHELWQATLADTPVAPSKMAQFEAHRALVCFDQGK